MEGHKDLARDPETRAIVNVNTLEYTQYLSRRDVKTEKNQKVQTMEEDLACLLYTSPSPRDVEESRMPSSA